MLYKSVPRDQEKSTFQLSAFRPTLATTTHAPLHTEFMRASRTTVGGSLQQGSLRAGPCTHARGISSRQTLVYSISRSRPSLSLARMCPRRPPRCQAGEARQGHLVRGSTRRHACGSGAEARREAVGAEEGQSHVRKRNAAPGAGAEARSLARECTSCALAPNRTMRFPFRPRCPAKTTGGRSRAEGGRKADRRRGGGKTGVSF